MILKYYKNLILNLLLINKIFNMKKIVLFIVLFCATLSASAQSLVISEIMYNNPGAGGDTLEYIEIYNKGNVDVNMNKFIIKTAFNDTFPNVTLAPGKFYVVCFNAPFFKAKMGFDAGHQWKNGALNNVGELIELMNNNNTLVDSARYRSIAPWPAQANGGGSSLVICDLNGSNDKQTDWTACTVDSGKKLNGIALFVTPGTLNCNGAAVLSATNDIVSTPKNTAIKIAVLRNDIATKPATIASVTAPIDGGTAVINAKKDTITFTPKTGSCNSDNFSYTITDGTLSSTATVTVNISGCVTVGTIAQVRAINATTGAATELGKTYEITGTLNSPNFRPNGTEFALMDNSGSGVIVYSAAKTFKYTPKEGDVVTVRGAVAQFNGLIQLNADTIIKTGTAAVAAVKVVTKLDESTEAIIVKLKNVTLVDATKWTTGLGTGGFTVDVTDGTNTFAVRIDKDIDLYNQAAPTGKLNISGVGYQFDNAAPFLEGYQLYPRYAKDIEKVVSTIDASIAPTVSVFPNPISSELNIKMEKAIQNINIYNGIGQNVLHINNPSDSETVNTNAWSNGIYFIEFSTNEGVYTTKVVKQ